MDVAEAGMVMVKLLWPGEVVLDEEECSEMDAVPVWWR